MKNELQKHKKSDGIKWFATLLAVLMLAVAVTAAITQGFKNWNPYGWFDKKEEQSLPEENGGAVINESTGNGITVKSVSIPKSEYSENGVSPLAETAYTLTATVIPAAATDQTLLWSVAFKNPSSSWANGKNVTDCVTVTPESEGAAKAVVQCLKEFGEQIIITVNSFSDPEVSATCTVDYAQRVTGLQSFSMKYGLTSDDGTWDEEYTYTFNSSNPADFVFKDLEDKDVGDFQFFVEREFSDWEYTFGTGTKKDTFSTTFKVRINPDFVKENSSVLSGVTFTDISESNFNLTFKGFYQMIGGISPATNSTLYNTLLNRLISYSGKPFELETTVTGTYSEITQKFKVGGNLTALKTAVTSIDLDNSAIIF